MAENVPLVMATDPPARETPRFEPPLPPAIPWSVPEVVARAEPIVPSDQEIPLLPVVPVPPVPVNAMVGALSMAVAELPKMPMLLVVEAKRLPVPVKVMLLEARSVPAPNEMPSLEPPEP